MNRSWGVSARVQTCRGDACLVALIVLGSGGLVQADFDPANPPQGLFEDHYYAVQLQGRKCGYARIAARREGEVIRSLNYVNIEIRRGPVPLKIVVKSVHRESLDGRAQGFEAEQYTSMMTIKYKGTISDGRLRLVIEQGDQQTVRTYRWDPRAHLAWRSLLAMRRRGLRVGDQFDLLAYDVLVRPDAPIPTHLKVLAHETIDLLGSKVQAYSVESTVELGMKLTTLSWLRDDGVPLISTVSLGFLKLRLVRCPRAFALQDLDPPELFAATLIRADRPIDARRADRVVYRLSLPGGMGQLELP
ncbi:MAG: hypothetical protein ACE5K7_06145, partial [Phycisphaerae bacterium]